MNYNTEILDYSEISITKAAEFLKNNEVVGIPTETVYGLAANAFNEQAVKKIFAAKGSGQIQLRRFKEISVY